MSILTKGKETKRYFTTFKFFSQNSVLVNSLLPLDKLCKNALYNERYVFTSTCRDDFFVPTDARDQHLLRNVSVEQCLKGIVSQSNVQPWLEYRAINDLDTLLYLKSFVFYRKPQWIYKICNENEMYFYEYLKLSICLAIFLCR